MEACRDIGDNNNVRPCPHGGDNPSKAGGVRINGHTEGQNGDSRFTAAEKLTEKAVLGQSLLEPRLLCHDGRDG